MPQPDGPGGQGHAHLAEVDDLLVHHTSLPQTTISLALDRGLILLGKAVSWLWLAVVGVIIYAVIGRYAFAQGTITLEELSWHIAGVTWLVGLSYTLTVDAHVRVDVLYERFGLRIKAWVELFGILLLLLPFLVFAFWEAVPYALSSWEQGERSQAPAGLTNRWILKAVMAASFLLLMIAAVSRLLRVTALLFGLPRPRGNGGAATGEGR